MLVEINFFGIFWLIALLGLANMAPVLCSPVPVLSRPVDFGKAWKGKRIFGDNKTWRGIVAASVFGFLFFIIQRYLFLHTEFFHNVGLFNYGALPWFYGIFIGLGAILGDLIKSFFKRRANIASGHSWVPFDQIDYLIGGMVALLPFYRPDIAVLSFIILFGFVLHLFVKFIGYILKISDKKI